MSAAAVVMGLTLRRFLSRWLPEDDPRRQLIAQAMLYGGTFIVISVSVWSRHRWIAAWRRWARYSAPVGTDSR